MPSRRLPAAPVLVALVAFLLAAAACSSVTKPEGWASPASGDGLLLFAHSGKLYALDAQTLTAKWQFPSPQQRGDKISPGAMYGTPAVADGMVYVPGYKGTLYALKEASGDVAWSARTGGPLIGGVAVSDGTVYFGSDDGKVYALDAKTGDPKWPPFKAGSGGVWSTPVVSGSTLYVTSLDRRLYALDLATGAEQWSFETDAGLASVPAVEEASGVVYVGGFDSQMRAIDTATPHQERWKIKAKNWFWARPLVSDNVVYAGSLDGKVYALDAASGKARWKPFDTGAPVRSTPMLVGGALIVVNKDGKVYSLDPDTGASKADALAINADVLSDPLVRTIDNGGPELLLVTNGGELVRVDPGTLRIVGRKLLSGG